MADVVKYGIQIPNRVFVGGVAFDTKEEDLKDFFTQYGKIKDCKIIKDNQQISRGFAFVTFECKSDAIQTQNLGTVYYNSKKLNLGPAIRQKGVVFNGTKDVENEPVLSTGVYIHPSGYSYTVAPNGVWYFHNSDGTPPTSTPGSPPLAYTSNIVRKTQLHARKHSVASSTGSTESPPESDLDNTPPSSHLNTVFPVPQTADASPPSTTRFIHPSPQFQSNSFYSPPPQIVPAPTYIAPNTPYTTGSPKIQLAFQNMSMQPQMPTGTHQANTKYHMGPVVPQAPSTPATHPMQYTRLTEMYVPFYPAEQQKVVTNGSNEQNYDRMSSAYQYQLHHPDCHMVSPAQYHAAQPHPHHIKEAYPYPYYQDSLRQHFIYPSTQQVDTTQPQQVYYSEHVPDMYKSTKILNMNDAYMRSSKTRSSQ